ncbi:cGMP-dependent 3',5'-cyclic phosphodiesterase-like [Ptychodera flava]|uniref:cGMP-dependent 3',5'-cyclic phosphodiesterase-like n=1 Tax=Ptychodera flava TaxID=63121 RepID=UPI003969D3A8
MMYHMQINHNECERLTTTPIPEPRTFQPDMDRFSCIPRSIAESDTSMAVISMFDDMGFIRRWRINKATLVRFCLMVKRGYRDPPYHNWYHAFSVGHFCYLLYKNLNLLEMLTEMEIFALFVACLCHDLDHRGTNNTFQVQSQSVLAALYSSEGSVLERHHFAQALCILNTDGCNIFENLTSPEYQEVLDLMQDIILATDLAHHLRITKDLQKMADEGYNKDDPKSHKLLLSLLMTSCDLSDQTKNWKTIKKIAELIYQEFFSQGDLEKAMGCRPLEMMDREKACIPELQLSFLNHIAHPVFQLLAKIIPEAKVLDDAVVANKAMWTHVKKETQRRKLSSTNSLDFFRLKLESVEKGIEDLKNGEKEKAEEGGDVNGGN